MSESFLSSQSHKPLELESSKIYLSQTRVTKTVESLRAIGLQARVNVFSMTFYAMKWCPTCYCCNLSVGVALNVRFITNGMCAMNNTHTYVARTSSNRVISPGDLYCCLLLQCEALRTCHSGFPIAAKWCCDQDVKVVPGAALAFAKRTCDRCGSL